MQIAFYKGTRPGIPGLFNRAVRWWTRGPYSHCELVLWRLADGRAVCGSSANLDGGVRRKIIDLDPERWDVIDLPWLKQGPVLDWFMQHDGEAYDTLGLFGFVWRRGDGDRDRWYCSEACAAAMGFDESWRFDPNTLAAVVRSMGRLMRPVSILEM